MKTIITGATRFSEHMCVHNPIRQDRTMTTSTIILLVIAMLGLYAPLTAAVEQEGPGQATRAAEVGAGPSSVSSASNFGDSSFSSFKFQRGESTEIQRLIGIRDCGPGLGTSG